MLKRRKPLRRRKRINLVSEAEAEARRVLEANTTRAWQREKNHCLLHGRPAAYTEHLVRRGKLPRAVKHDEANLTPGCNECFLLLNGPGYLGQQKRLIELHLRKWPKFWDWFAQWAPHFLPEKVEQPALVEG